MTLEEFLAIADNEYDREMIKKMQEERNGYINYRYEGSLPENAYINVNDIFRLVDECKMNLLKGGKYIDANGGLFFLDNFAQRVIEIFNRGHGGIYKE